MLIPHVVQTEADKIFVNVLNTQAVSVTDGDAVVWDITTPDGVRTTQAATDTIGLFVGFAQGTIPASGYGLAQAYGYKSSAQVSTDTATTSCVAGSCLVPLAATDAVTQPNTGTAPGTLVTSGAGGFAYSAEARTDTITLAAQKVFVRAL